MQMASQSVLEWLGLPLNFGYALLIIGLVLSLSPYLGGSDFGVVKFPDFKPPVRTTLRTLGPMVMLGAVLVHVQFLPAAGPNGDEPVTPEPVRPVAEGSAGRGPLEPSPASVGATSYAPGSDVLAPVDGGQCLYAATVVGRSSHTENLWYSFGKGGYAPEAQLRTPPVSPLADPAPGATVFARLDGSDIWAPGVIKEIRSGRALAVLEPTTDCAGRYMKPYVWSESNR